jgi:hypothetical protein
MMPTTAGSFRRRESKPRRAVLGLVSVVLAISSGVTAHGQQVPTEVLTSNPQASRPIVAEGVDLPSANVLYREFQDNPVDASNQYVGKAVVLDGLRGEVILRSDGIGAVVHIADRGRSNALILSFNDRNELSGLKPGQRFRFKCLVGKYEYSIVWLEDCSIER